MFFLTNSLIKQLSKDPNILLALGYRSSFRLTTMEALPLGGCRTNHPWKTTKLSRNTSMGIRWTPLSCKHSHTTFRECRSTWYTLIVCELLRPSSALCYVFIISLHLTFINMHCRMSIGSARGSQLCGMSSLLHLRRFSPKSRASIPC